MQQSQDNLVFYTERTPAKASRNDILSPHASENRLSQIDLRCRVADLYIPADNRSILEEDTVIMTEQETPKVPKSPVLKDNGNQTMDN